MTSPIATKPISEGALTSVLPGRTGLPKTLPPGGTATHITPGSTSVTPTTPPPATPPADTVPVAPPNTGLIDDSGYTAIIQSTLALYGLQSLVPQVVAWGKAGASTDQINLELQQTPEWHARFAGNDQRIQQGLAPLDPTTYIALESQYDQILSDLPAGFYQKSDIDNLIGNNVSPSKLSDDVQLANQLVQTGPEEYRQAYQAYNHVVGPGGIVAAILDPSKAEPLVQQQVLAAQIGGTALQQGLNLTSSANATKAAQQGVTLQQAQQAYQQIASRLQTDRATSARFNAPIVNQDTEEQANLLGNAAALHRQNLIGTEEESLFGGHGASSQIANSPGNI